MKVFFCPFQVHETGETKELGSSPDKLYLDIFLKVSKLVCSQGKTLMVWSDMFAKYPKLIPQITLRTIVVPWGYDLALFEPYWKLFAMLPVPNLLQPRQASGTTFCRTLISAKVAPALRNIPNAKLT